MISTADSLEPEPEPVYPGTDKNWGQKTVPKASQFTNTFLNNRNCFWFTKSLNLKTGPRKVPCPHFLASVGARVTKHCPELGLEPGAGKNGGQCVKCLCVFILVQKIQCGSQYHPHPQVWAPIFSNQRDSAGCSVNKKKNAQSVAEVIIWTVKTIHYIKSSSGFT